jgi:large subunit ribosomal protein L21
MRGETIARSIDAPTPTGSEREEKMFAVIKTGGKQYRVAANDLIEVDKIEGEAGASVAFSDVLVLGGDETVVGTPTVGGASVAAEVVEQSRKPKVIAFKKRRRKNSRRKRGHRQEFTLVRITEILAGAPSARAKAAEPAASAAPAEPTSAAQPEAPSAGAAETQSAAKTDAPRASRPPRKGAASEDESA